MRKAIILAILAVPAAAFAKERVRGVVTRKD